jgi:MOSC domain-containing protein YiiM
VVGKFPDQIYAAIVSSQIGRVESLHLHPPVSGEPFREVIEVFAEAGKGFVGDSRVFGKKRSNGQPNKRQVSLIAREQISEHVTNLKLPEIAPGVVRSNVETNGIDLMSLVGREVKVGEAVMLFYEPRTPCKKMELIAPGLQAAMALGRQGVMAQVVQSGKIKVGDAIEALPTPKDPI